MGAMRKRAESSFRQSRGRVDRRTGALVARLALAGLAFAGLAFAGLCLTGAPAALAAGGGLSVSDAWMRIVIPQRPAAGYFKLSNDGDAAVDLTGASSPACGMVMLHESVKENAVDQMLPVDNVPVPAHGSVSFKPGGYHLMCMHPTADVKAGGKISMTLEFKDATKISVDFPVRNAKGQ